MRKFSKYETGELLNYVYALVDPASRATFYVGRGVANRAFSHLSAEGDSRKAMRIREIRSQGLEPQIEILRYGLSLDEARLVEATVIDALGPDNLLNEIRGAGVEQGRISVSDFQRKFGAKEKFLRDVEGPLMLIFVNQTWSADKSEIEIYDSIRQFWHGVSKVNRTPVAVEDPNTGEITQRLPYPVAVGVVDSVVMRAYSVHAWYPAGSTFSTRLSHTNPEVGGNDKYEFVGQILPDHPLLGVRLLADDGKPIRHHQKGFGYVNAR